MIPLIQFYLTKLSLRTFQMLKQWWKEYNVSMWCCLICITILALANYAAKRTQTTTQPQAEGNDEP